MAVKTIITVPVDIAGAEVELFVVGEVDFAHEAKTGEYGRPVECAEDDSANVLYAFLQSTSGQSERINDLSFLPETLQEHIADLLIQKAYKNRNRENEQRLQQYFVWLAAQDGNSRI